MMCEGEYFGLSYSKSGDGQAHRRLTCSMLHGAWKAVRYANIAGMLSQGAAQGATGSPLVNQQLSASVSSQRVGTEATGQVDPLLVPVALSVLIDQTTGPGTRFSAFLPRFIEAAMNQTPVDAYYMYARRMLSKMICLKDEQLGIILDQARLKDLLKNGVNAMGIGPSTTLDEIIQAYEAVAFYRHVVILAPPAYSPSSGQPTSADSERQGMLIPEVFFMPYLYFTVPPACNVIFRDQIQAQNSDIDFRSIPTRVVTKLQIEATTTGIPKMYMVNGNGGKDPIASLLNTSVPPSLAATHEFLSAEELDRGVNIEYEAMSMERIVGTDLSAADRPAFESYLDQCTRHQFEVARGAPISRTVNIAFNPYIVPGFSAIVDDAGSPIYGMVAAISHTLTAEGNQSTSVVLTHVRELYITQGQNRTPFPPVYLNKLYRPENIAETYTKILGNNLLGDRSAMLPKEDILASVQNAITGKYDNYLSASRADLDTLASQVIPVPTYSKDGEFQGASEPAIWSTVRGSPANAQENAARFQFRPGTYLSDYIRMHVLQVDDLTTIDDSHVEPPADLAPTRTSEGGHRLFGSPTGLRYKGRDGDPTKTTPDIAQAGNGSFGLYEPVTKGAGVISDERQRLTRMIQAALDRGASVT